MEILFAVAVLSIGLIAVAGALYVGVDQTRASYDDTAAAAVARQAAAVMGQVMTTANTQDTGLWLRFPDSAPLNAAVSGSQISSADPRYAWTATYRRASESPTAEVFIVVLRSEAKAAFDARDLINYDGTPDWPATLVPMKSNDLIEVADGQLQFGPDVDPGRIGPGTIVILQSVPSDPGFGGRILRISGPGDAGKWQLAPGADAQGASLSGYGSIVGRGYADVTRPREGFAGANQAVAAYATIVGLQVVP